MCICFCFQRCESCRTKLRSYRGLLTHLHTCSKVSRGKSKPPEQTHPQPNAASKSTDQHLPRVESVSAPQQLRSQKPDGAVRPADPQADSVLPLPEASPPQRMLIEKAANIPPSLNVGGSKANPDPPDIQGQHQTQTKSPEAVHPSPASTPHSPPALSAVWKKNQGEYILLLEHAVAMCQMWFHVHFHGKLVI